MRMSADILSSAPAMQIRYLEAMQAMAKTSNSKVIFLPASQNTNLQEQLKVAEEAGEGPSKYGAPAGESSAEGAGKDDTFQQTLNARVMESI